MPRLLFTYNSAKVFIWRWNNWHYKYPILMNFLVHWMNLESSQWEHFCRVDPIGSGTRGYCLLSGDIGKECSWFQGYCSYKIFKRYYGMRWALRPVWLSVDSQLCTHYTLQQLAVSSKLRLRCISGSCFNCWNWIRSFLRWIRAYPSLIKDMAITVITWPKCISSCR